MSCFFTGKAMIIKRDPDIVKGYFEDSSNLKGGSAEGIAVPESIEELSAFLAEANTKKLPVTVSGGGTSTTGSRIPFGGMVISTEKLNRISGISAKDMSATLQTGALVDDLKKACDKEGLFYTCHPTEASATVGGTVATNASGARSFKYGPTRRYIRRLKMVLASGEVFELRRGERILTRRDPVVKLPGGRVITVPIPTYRMPEVKNSAGYFAKDEMDLIDLFIGQEGTLSVIAELNMALAKKPEKILSAFAFFPKEEDAWQFATEARGRDALSIEYFSANALELLRSKNPNVPSGAASAIFFEQELARGREDALIDAWLALISKHHASIDDTWVAMTEKEAAEFNSFRYAMPEAVNDTIRRNGRQKLSTDIAVPDSHFMEMMRFYSTSLKDAGIENVIFGHIGECHVHVNLLPKTDEEAAKAKDLVIAFVRKGVSFGGTVSAEHGIGKIKHRYLEEMYGKAGILEMARVKKAFDPNCILGLDNMFPKEVLGEV
jgi:D-lactate dehydrogenase (cytochrome)